MQNTSTDKKLKDEQYYIDLYDQHTVDECYRLLQKFFYAHMSDEIKSKHSIETQIEQFQKIVGITLNCFCGERYINKAKTIQEWMDKDHRLDEFLESTQPSKGVLCNKCASPMNCTNKHLYGINDEKVLFFFRCYKCSKSKAFFDTGKEFKTTYTCPKCGEIAKVTYTRKKNKITAKYKCLHCGLTEKSVLALDKGTDEIHDEDFLAAKKQFCLSKEEGDKYIDGKRRLIHATDRFKEIKEQEKQKDLYDTVTKVKKLNIAELEKQLLPALEKEGYKSLELLKPELGRIIVIEFTVQDATSGIHEHTRRMTLKKTINKALMETNWKLGEGGISYRLGIISGRLRGFEFEEDIAELVKARQKKLDKVK